MQNPKLKSLVFTILICWIVLSIPTKSFSHNRFNEPISNELSSLFETKKKNISSLISASQNDKWSGVYSSLLFTTVSLTLYLSPDNEFAISYFNCSKPWTERVNFGKVIFENDVLKLIPELQADTQNAYKFRDEELTLVPVKWGEQSFLIPQNKLENFAYAANFDSALELFLEKTGNYNKSRKGLPDLPIEYRKFLTKKPIRARIIDSVRNEEIYLSEIILNVGKKDGVIPGMFFYSVFSKNTHIRISIDSVGEITSRASIAHVESEDSNNLKIKKGWSFTSKHPQSGNYFPY